MLVGARRIRSEKLRENQYREGYVRSLEGKELEWDGDNNVEHMWEQVKRESWGKNPKTVWWNDDKKTAVRIKEAAWKGVLAAIYIFIYLFIHFSFIRLLL